jgi:hypothetical protein
MPGSADSVIEIAAQVGRTGSATTSRLTNESVYSCIRASSESTAIWTGPVSTQPSPMRLAPNEPTAEPTAIEDQPASPDIFIAAGNTANGVSAVSRALAMKVENRAHG